ncbi:Fic family protein [Mycoplasmopsis primatum]|uniref:Fic family protein n=1 Tax=Mycoplasmopsis primatum TaxID=55604 RepID=UPI0004970A67|nr:Fic family protein [Mycoplasmopsis primatum]
MNRRIQKFALIFSTFSCNIDKNSFTVDETKELISKGSLKQTKKAKEILEIKNHYQTVIDIYENNNQCEEINIYTILTLHSSLMKGLTDEEGAFKSIQNSIENSQYEPSQPGEVKEAIAKILNEYNLNIKKVKSVKEKYLIIAQFHINFQKIHPFAEGNGRVGRAITLIQCLSLKLLPLYVDFKDKLKYFNFLEKGEAENYNKVFSVFS